MSGYARFLGWISLCALAGCIGMTNDGGSCPAPNSSSSSSGGGNNGTPPGRTVDVAACAGGASQSTIDTNLQMVDYLEDDYHEMVVCGGLAQSFSYSLSEFFARVACGQTAYPSGLVYTGSGLYLAGNVMQIQAKLKKDTSFGKAGDDVPFDLFDTASYWKSSTINANIEADFSWSTNQGFDAHLKGSIEFTKIEEPSKNLEIWGIPTDGTSTTVQQEELAKRIADAVEFTIDIQMESSQGTKYRITSPPLSAGDMYEGKELDLPVTFIEATSGTQTATLSNWGMKFLPTQAGDMDGTITMSVTGGDFPYFVKYSYPQRSTPDILVTCTDPNAP